LSGESFSLPSINYDKNSNITTLQRYGKDGNSFNLIDDLTYNYNGNRLNQITDAVAGSHDVDLVPRSGGNYSYYADGSLKSDANEQISNIIYDSFLEQQAEVLLTDGRKIKYTYNGAGDLINTTYFDASDIEIERWDFVEKAIYKNGGGGQPLLHQISDDEGRISFTNGSYSYEFDYKDHLGNTRTSFHANGSN
jgi:hypothetical protein